MPRLQDILFFAWGLVIALLLAFQLRIAVVALLGAFACGSIYLLAAMLPSRNEGFWNRAFTSVFLATVMASLVLILPATLGARGPDVQAAVMTVAALLPLAAFCFEVVRTPRVLQTILRHLGYR